MGEYLIHRKYIGFQTVKRTLDVQKEVTTRLGRMVEVHFDGHDKRRSVPINLVDSFRYNREHVAATIAVIAATNQLRE